MAEALLKKYVSEMGKDGLEISSAGTGTVDGMKPTEHTLTVLREEGVSYGDFLSRRLYARFVDDADLILVMQQQHKNKIVHLYPQAEAKVRLFLEFAGEKPDLVYGFDVADPIGMSLGVYRDVKDQIKRACQTIAARL